MTKMMAELESKDLLKSMDQDLGYYCNCLKWLFTCSLATQFLVIKGVRTVQLRAQFTVK
ncbi:MAG: hypothetical protein GF364_02515 [Candidatus Lokiarchaeota archaeon]|nr:hypothetical protein [Candidatus Lokiarchaeota archaeon]